MQEQPPGQHGHNGLQAEDQAGDGGVDALLPDDLEGIAHAGGQDTGVQNGCPGLEHIAGRRHALRAQHTNHGEKARHEELDAGHLYPVHFRAEMVNDHDVTGESQGTQQHQQVTLLELEGAAHTQQIQAEHGDDHADPELHAHFFVEKQAQNGDDDDVHGGDKAGLSGAGVDQTHLLKGVAQEHTQAAA